MALTEAQKEQVYEFLGYPTVTTFGTPSQTLATILASLTANTETRVAALLTLIATSRTDIAAARGRLKAAEVGDIKLNGNELRDRWREDYRLCRQLSILLGVPLEDHPAPGRVAPEVCS